MMSDSRSRSMSSNWYLMAGIRLVRKGGGSGS